MAGSMIPARHGTSTINPTPTATMPITTPMIDPLLVGAGMFICGGIGGHGVGPPAPGAPANGGGAPTGAPIPSSGACPARTHPAIPGRHTSVAAVTPPLAPSALTCSAVMGPRCDLPSVLTYH